MPFQLGEIRFFDLLFYNELQIFTQLSDPLYLLFKIVYIFDNIMQSLQLYDIEREYFMVFLLHTHTHIYRGFAL